MQYAMAISENCTLSYRSVCYDLRCLLEFYNEAEFHLVDLLGVPIIHVLKLFKLYTYLISSA
jgi:hypothetical protein